MENVLNSPTFTQYSLAFALDSLHLSLSPPSAYTAFSAVNHSGMSGSRCKRPAAGMLNDKC